MCTTSHLTLRTAEDQLQKQSCEVGWQTLPPPHTHNQHWYRDPTSAKIIFGASNFCEMQKNHESGKLYSEECLENKHDKFRL